jgi:4-carboxymuconolactone decarboxylase
MATDTDRLPMPSPLTTSQRAAVDAIVSGPRGTLVGPFVPLLRSPELMTRVQLVGEYLRFDSALPGHLRELAILIVARYWNQDFEWGHHVPLARAAGLDAAVIRAVGQDNRAARGSDDVRAVWRFVEELIHDHAITDATFASALELLGDGGTVELVVLTGYYSTLAMMMNAARTPTPENYEHLPSQGSA